MAIQLQNMYLLIFVKYFFHEPVYYVLFDDDMITRFGFVEWLTNIRKDYWNELKVERRIFEGALDPYLPTHSTTSVYYRIQFVKFVKHGTIVKYISLKTYYKQ